VRRALEAEVAALAAERRGAGDILAIQQAVQALDAAVQAGGNGVDEDVKFHRAIADATRNPFLIQTLEYLGQFLHGATQVTRANEARRIILQAVEAGDAEAARQAAATHMGNAILRIQGAPADFWRAASLNYSALMLAALTTAA